MDVTQLIARIQRKEVHIGIIGLGYVGLPLARLLSGTRCKARQLWTTHESSW